MSVRAQKAIFETSKRVYESAILTFKGVEGWDVYNCSVPFMYKGARHIYGRVEKREEWANSHVRLFVETGKDEFSAVPDVIFQLEDPYVAKIHNELILGGTHVRKMSGEIKTYYGYFFRGTPQRLTYFTTGPDYMKDIRVVELADHRIGVFSRPRSDSAASIGFTIIDKIEQLDETVIAQAKPLAIIDKDTWGGVNQPYLLANGKIGCIAHYGYDDKKPDGGELTVYVNYAFVLDPKTRHVEDAQVIGTMSCYPACTPKLPRLADCVFTSGIAMRQDGKCDLYTGMGDTCEGRITIDYPFEKHGRIVGDLDFSTSHTKSSL